jgi:CRP/FNR family cyclic AMP-dependent transcriptional regulator
MSTAELTNPELPAIGFAAELSDDERRALSCFGDFLPGHPDVPLIKEGTDQSSLFFVISGKLHAQTEADGRRILLGRLQAGDIIGEVNIFDPGTASATVTPVEFSQLWRLDRTMFDDLVGQEPLIAVKLLTSIATQLSKRLRDTNDKVTYVKKALFDPSFLS